MEFNEENFNKLLTENGNYKQAIQEERSKRKALQAEVEKLSKSVEEMEGSSLDVLAKEREEKKKLEEQLAEKDKVIAAKDEELEKANGKATKLDEVMNKSLEEKLAMIPEAKRDFVNKVLDGKDHDSKVEILDGFITDFNQVKDVKTTPNQEGGGVDPDPKAQRFAELKDKIDKREKVSPSEKGEYLQLLRERTQKTD